LTAPGLSKEDFKVTIDNGILNISAEIEDKKEEKGQYKDGVLKLKLHKLDEVKSKPTRQLKSLKLTVS